MKFVTRLCAVVALSVGLIAGCNKGGGGGSKGGGDGPGPVPPGDGSPIVSLSPQTYDLFGYFASTSPAQQTMTITNDANSPQSILIKKITITTEPSRSEITIDDSNQCINQTIQPGGSCSYTTKFDVSEISSEINGTGSTQVDYSYGTNDASLKSTFTYSAKAKPATGPLGVFVNGVSPQPSPLSIAINGTYNNVSISGKRSIYGSSVGLVLYNTGSDPISFPTCTPDKSTDCLKSIQFDTGSNPDLSVNYRSCRDMILRNSIGASHICGFEIIYMPTKDIPASGRSTLKIQYQVGTTKYTIDVPVNFSVDIESTSIASYETFVKSFLSGTGTGTGTNKFGIYNNCKEDAWIENKPVNPANGSPSIISKSYQVQKDHGIIYDDKISEISGGATTIQKGIASLNIYAKFGCDTSGDSAGKNCKIGEVLQDTNPGYKNGTVCGLNNGLTNVDNVLSGNKYALGCQADIGTKFEASFGCSLDQISCGSDPSCPCAENKPLKCPSPNCAKNPSDGTLLSQSTFFDGSFVDGFSYNIAVDVFRGTNPKNLEANPGCFANKSTTLSVSEQSCGTENMDPSPGQWSLLSKDDATHWQWTDTEPPMNWSADEIGIIDQIGRTNWNGGINDLIITLKGWQTTPPTFPICRDDNNTQNCISPNTSLVFPEDPKNFQCLAPWLHPSGAPRNPNTTIDLTKIPLYMRGVNRDTQLPKNGEGTDRPVDVGPIIGCASPKSILGSPYQWGSYNFGAACSYVGGLYFDSNPTDPTTPQWTRYYDRPPSCADPKNCIPSSAYSPDYSNLRLMFSNPFSNDDLLTPNIASGLSDYGNSVDSAFIYNTLIQFCKSHSGFCKGSDGKPLSGLANIIGNMGPVRLTKYVKTISNKGSGNYSWQYDDFNATRVCDAPDTKIILILCGKDSTGSKNFPLD